MNRLRRVPTAAWLALCLHGPLVLAGFYRFSYDAGTHEFLADHYLRSPLGLWDPRWFTGFAVSSYPPLVHQIMAIVGALTGVEAAFGLLLLATLVVFPLAMLRFARLFVTRRAAAVTAIVAVFLPSVALTGHAFGQLPTLVSLVLVLTLAVEWVRFIDRGERTTLALVAALAGLAFAAHHATPVLLLPALLVACFLATADRAPLTTRATRAAIATTVCAVLGGLAVLPFWIWTQQAPPQVPIPHLSRANFLTDGAAQSLFFWGMFGVLPAIALVGVRSADRRGRVLALFALAFGVIGLGGTTALPALLFGGGWEWLTYDRFALWSTVFLLPLVGLVIERTIALRTHLGRAAGALAIGTLGVFATLDSATLLGTMPRQHDLAPIAAFLDSDGRASWRYQTFGFGDASTRLGYLTTATTIDGAYFTARGVPELQASGIGMLDYALWWDPSGAALRDVLAASDAYSIRWAFVAEPRYEPFLAEAGFRWSHRIADGIAVWENADAPSLDPRARSFGAPDAQGILWGTVPLALLAAALLLTLRRGRGAPAVLGGRARDPWHQPHLSPGPASYTTPR